MPMKSMISWGWLCLVASFLFMFPPQPAHASVNYFTCPGNEQPCEYSIIDNGSTYEVQVKQHRSNAIVGKTAFNGAPSGYLRINFYDAATGALVRTHATRIEGDYCFGLASLKSGKYKVKFTLGEMTGTVGHMQVHSPVAFDDRPD